MPLKEDDKEAETTIAVKNEEIHENDVLMGRGGKNNRHIGNERLRDIARGHVEKYKVSSKKVKSGISRDIVKQVRAMDPPGRFLKRVPETGEWEDVGDYLAREKVAQVLRDAVCEAIEAMRPNVPPHMVASAASQFAHHHDQMAVASGVFRQGPMVGNAPFGMGEEGGKASLQGVVTSSSSGSYGHPTGYFAPPPPWYPYGQPHPQSYHPPQPYPGMPPFPPRFQQAHPQHLAPNGSYVPRPQPPAPASQAASQAASESSAQTQPATANNVGTGGGSLPPGYSISLSVAAGPGAMPLSGRTEAYMSWHPPGTYHTPVQREEGRKRSRSLPEDAEDDTNSTPPENSPTPSKTPNKKSSATQTPTYHASPFIPRGTTESSPVAIQPLPHAWQQPYVPPMVYPPGQGPPQHEHVYYEQRTQHYFGHQSTFQPHPQPMARAFSAPLPGQGGLGQAGGASAAESRESESSSHSMVERSSHATFSSRKAQRIIPRPDGEEGNANRIIPIVPPEQRNIGVDPQHPNQETAVDALEPMLALPSAVGQRRHHSMPGQAQGPRRSPPAGHEGMEWFAGQLLLESDGEEDTEHSNDNNQYPV